MGVMLLVLQKNACLTGKKLFLAVLPAMVALFLGALPGSFAWAGCTDATGNPIDCDGDTTIPAFIGGGDSTTGDGRTINVGRTTPGTLQASGGGTVISVHDSSTIIVGSGATVQGRANSGNGSYGTGPNVIEARTGNVITIQQGATVTQLGNTNNGEAINVHGYNNVITNNGTIHSHNGAALWFQDVATSNDPNERNKVINNVTGTISTDKGAGYNVFGSSRGSAGPGLDFENYGTIVGSLLFGEGDDSLLFGATSQIRGNVDGGGGTNDLTLQANAGQSATLAGAVANFTTITKTGAGAWAILGGVEYADDDPNNPTPSPITGSLEGITSLIVEGGLLSLVGANPDFTGTTRIDAGAELSVQAAGINHSTQVTNNGTLTFDQAELSPPNYTGAAITGTGMVVKVGVGDLVMDSLGTNTYSGGTWIKEGALVIDEDEDLGATGSKIIMGTDSDGPGSEAANVDATGGVRLDKTGEGVLALYGTTPIGAAPGSKTAQWPSPTKADWAPATSIWVITVTPPITAAIRPSQRPPARSGSTAISVATSSQKKSI